MTEVVLYQLFDRYGALLYVGVTENLTRRMYQHKRSKPWWRRVRRTATETYPTRADAIEVESAIIRAERPPHNHCWIAESRVEKQFIRDYEEAGHENRYRDLCQETRDLVDSMTPEQWEAELSRWSNQFPGAFERLEIKDEDEADGTSSGKQKGSK